MYRWSPGRKSIRLLVSFEYVAFRRIVNHTQLWHHCNIVSADLIWAESLLSHHWHRLHRHRLQFRPFRLLPQTIVVAIQKSSGAQTFHWAYVREIATEIQIVSLCRQCPSHYNLLILNFQSLPIKGRGNLVCHQRNKFQAVPGCRGGESNGSYTDYCVSRGGVAVAMPVAAPVSPPTRQGSGLGDSNYRFQLRLYWQNGYTWQETTREAWWCMQCARCNKFSLGDGPNVGCKVTGSNGSSCRAGDNIWIRQCKDRSRDYQFNIIKNPGSGDQVRVDGTNLCLSTVNNRYLELRDCDRSSPRQLWKGIDNINKFELRPYHQRDWGLSDAKCLSQLHHPKVSSNSLHSVVASTI